MTPTELEKWAEEARKDADQAIEELSNSCGERILKELDQSPNLEEAKDCLRMLSLETGIFKNQDSLTTLEAAHDLIKTVLWESFEQKRKEIEQRKRAILRSIRKERRKKIREIQQARHDTKAELNSFETQTAISLNAFMLFNGICIIACFFGYYLKPVLLWTPLCLMILFGWWHWNGEKLLANRYIRTSKNLEDLNDELRDLEATLETFHHERTKGVRTCVGSTRANCGLAIHLRRLWQSHQSVSYQGIRARGVRLRAKKTP